MQELPRYLSLGVVTTVVTYATYLLLLDRLGPHGAYFVALLVGIAIQGAALVPFVFRLEITLLRSLKAAGLYILYAGFFFAVLSAALFLGVPPAFAPAVTIAISVPLHWLAGRTVFSVKR